MAVKYKYFVISDIHGFYKETIKALKEKGYDSNNENHMLLVLGDIFDRGNEALEIYNWLKDLTDRNKAIVLKGNHDDFLIKFLTDYNTMENQFNFYNNGLESTIKSFLKQDKNIREYYKIKEKQNIKINKFMAFKAWNSYAKDIINKKYPYLLLWMNSFPYYYETKNYIFTHASLDTECKDFRNPTKNFDDLLWDNGTFFKQDLKNINKTVVVGHFSTSETRKMYDLENKNSHDILIREDKKIIMIDGIVANTKKVNVLVLTDESI